MASAKENGAHASDPERAISATANVPTKLTYWNILLDQGVVTTDVLNHHYDGAGTESDPYLVTWIPHDPRNPMNFSVRRKWTYTVLTAFATMAVALTSTAYTGGIRQVIVHFGIGTELATLGVSLFVVGFAIGPLMWAPFSELFGRQLLFVVTYGAFTAFNGGAVASQNIETLLIMRFFAGSWGSSPLTNSGGVIADMFSADQRGLATSIFASAPFLGPSIGPIISSFIGETSGWQWVMGFAAIFTGALWIICSLTVPETYAVVLLRKRAARLSKLTGKVYVSKIEKERGKVRLGEAFKIALSRPWILLFREPIVFLLSIYMAIIYGTLYMLFAAFPIVYEEKRGWSQGIGSLAFLGVLVGMLGALTYNIFLVNKQYIRTAERHGGSAPPEARLPPCMIGGILIPIGLFWFAWSDAPSVHWIVSIMASAPFGAGMVLVFLSIMNYLIDAYTIYAASVLAANSVLRSLFGAAFPLFTTQMYDRLGIHWASSIPAFLALACVPFPFIFYKYGAGIRQKCKFAAESEAFMTRMREAQNKEDRAADLEQEEKTPVDSGDDDRGTIGSEYEQPPPRTLSQSTAASSASSDHHHQKHHSRTNEEQDPTTATTKTSGFLQSLSRTPTQKSTRSSRSRSNSRPTTPKSSRSKTSLSLKRTQSGYQGDPYELFPERVAGDEEER